jgi:hypothetical protein
MKKLLIPLFVLTLAFSSLPFVASAQAATQNAAISGTCDAGNGFVTLSCIPGLSNLAGADNLTAFFQLLYTFCIGIAVVIAVLQISRAGVMYMVSQGNTSTITEAKRLIWASLLGLALILSPVVIFKFINPNINRFDVISQDAQALTISQTALNQGQGGAGGGAANTTTNSSGCTITGTLLQKASCPTSQAAQDFAAACSGKGAVTACQSQNSSGCVDTNFQASCSVSKGPFLFIDTSQGGFTAQGILNGIIGYSHYEPLAKSSSDENNGQDVLSFVQACSADGGSVCMSEVIFSSTCTYNSGQSTSQSNACYTKKLSCEDAGFIGSITDCSKNPSFTVVN